MAQRIFREERNGYGVLELPAPTSRVMGEVKWGRADVLFTPAFWAAQVFLLGGVSLRKPHRLGRSFREEVVACLLCTHGVPSEHGLAAFERLRQLKLLEPARSSVDGIERALREPLRVSDRTARYRFPRQKAIAVHEAVTRTPLHATTTCPQSLRRDLQGLRGIGPKIASWIVRNYLECDAVAVIDIHIHRACVLAGVFPEGVPIDRHYEELERRYLSFAKALEVPAHALDSVMWSTMRFASAARIL